MQTAAAYIRVSTEDQAEYSPESQRKLILRYARQHGWQVPENLIFIDEGISGRKAEKRPAFMRMIAAAKQKPKPFAAILVYSFSRFARNREDSVVYKRMLRKDLGVELISISQELGHDKTAVLVEALLEAMDEYYSIDLGENVKRGMVEKVERGEPVTVAPFGYKMENRKYVPSDQAPLVREIFHLFLSGVGYREIAERLNAMGLRTAKGNRWEPRGIAYVLQNPVYRGKIRWNPNGRAGRSFVPRMETQGAHQPLVDEETWNLAQERAALLRRYPKKERMTGDGDWGPVQGLVFCGDCGGRLVRSGKNSYQCGNYAKGKCKVSHSIGRDLLWKMVRAALEADIGELPMPAEQGGPSKTETIAAKKAMEQLTRAEAAYMAGVDTLEEYACKKRRLLDILERCRNQEQESPRQGQRTVGDFLTGDAPPKEKNLFLSRLIHRIIFDKPYRFQIIYHG